MLDKIIENKIVEVKTLKAKQKYSLSSLSGIEVDKRPVSYTHLRAHET